VTSRGVSETIGRLYGTAYQFRRCISHLSLRKEVQDLPETNYTFSVA